MLGGGGYHQVKKHMAGSERQREPWPFFWQHYNRLDGYYNGMRTLVPYSEYQPENQWNQSYPPPRLSAEEMTALPKEPPMDPVKYDPYEDLLDGRSAIKQCYLDEAETMPAPDIYAYPGLPQNMSLPFYGSYSELGLQEDVCFERFGRLAPYGYGLDERRGGLGAGNQSENAGADKVFAMLGNLNYSSMDWGGAQRRCREKNEHRFSEQHKGGKRPVQRQAYVLRTWTGYNYGEHEILSMRAMINELALKSGGEYDVHLLLHVKNNSLPIWASDDLYRETLEANVPREFWNITTLWSEKQMEMYYPDPFPDNFANMAGSNLHGVYRSAHFALQWFSQQHLEYDYFWNWEMDIRYTGHYYDLNNRVGKWARAQPRKGLWERSRRFYIPARHGNYANFTNTVAAETLAADYAANDIQQSGPLPVWGPVQDFPNRGMLSPPANIIPPTTYAADTYTWGVDEPADLITFNPLFDPSHTNWVFSWDITGYDRSLPPPPRRAAIITCARLSRRLLDTMHAETWQMRHTMFPEMWPPSVALHHGLKAVYAPHPVYFDRDWDPAYMDQVLNYPETVWASPFGWGENNLLGSSFYYNSGFSGALWRRWLGQREGAEGGKSWEESGSGRLCLRAGLFHPVKHEVGPED
ncbi:hypothetical protein B0A50_06310 [Salinomyces thailandicus]|uniref:Uncharacterized protein n=1 Tax=Salinomyces thailandicus TaxID=706561 RepID=A0A4U0TT62_9PEZI|nr:hypothetical protein B0A50_06310 [Salinomyces thailandica]